MKIGISWLLRWVAVGAVVSIVMVLVLDGSPEAAVGDVVKVLPVAQCEGHYLRPDELDLAVQSLTTPEHELDAVFQAPQTWLGGEFAAVFSSVSSDLGPTGQELLIAYGGIVAVDFGCAQSPEQFVEGVEGGDFIVTPRN